MSENVTPVVTDDSGPVVVKISNPDEFRKVAGEYGIPVKDRGRLPKRELLAALWAKVNAGEVRVIDTDFFGAGHALGLVKATRTAKAEVSYAITYHVLNKNGKPMPSSTLVLTSNEIKSYLPHVKGMVNVAMATMAVALHRAKEGALLTDLSKYVVTDVKDTSKLTQPAMEDVNTDAQVNADSTNDADKSETSDVVADERVLTTV